MNRTTGSADHLSAERLEVTKPPNNLLISLLLNYTAFSTELLNCIPRRWRTRRLTRSPECKTSLRRTERQNAARPTTASNRSDSPEDTFLKTFRQRWVGLVRRFGCLKQIFFWENGSKCKKQRFEFYWS